MWIKRSASGSATIFRNLIPIPMTMSPRHFCIGIVDDDDSVRTSISRLIRSAGWYAEAFAGADEFMQAQRACCIDCLVADLRMPGSDGFQMHEWMLVNGMQLPVIFLTAYGDVATGVQAMKRGAADFLQKPVDDEILLDAIRQAICRHAISRMQAHEHEEIKARHASLTLREQEVMRHVVDGRLNKQIAADLGISLKTVKVHRARALEKMGVHSVAKLVHLCVKAGIAQA
jgi:FixJ family two-component response regulator